MDWLQIFTTSVASATVWPICNFMVWNCLDIQIFHRCQYQNGKQQTLKAHIIQTCFLFTFCYVHTMFISQFIFTLITPPALINHVIWEFPLVTFSKHCCSAPATFQSASLFIFLRLSRLESDTGWGDTCSSRDTAELMDLSQAFERQQTSEGMKHKGKEFKRLSP